MTAKLYAIVGPSRYDRDYPGFVVDEAGEVLYQHISSSDGWAQHDLTRGIGRRTDLAERFPDGYELVFINRLTDAPPDVLAATVRRAEA